MNKQEMIAKIAEMVMSNPEMKASMEAMLNGVPDAETAAIQKPGMMYVLTQKIRVVTDDDSEVYHYHPVVMETLLIPGCECNQMVSSSNLLELQNTTKDLCRCWGCSQFQILAMKTEEYERLQNILDQTVTGIIENTHRAVEAFLQNASYIGRDAISFESIYERIMMQMMTGSHGSVGAALNAESEIIESIEGVEYEYPCSCCDEDDEDEDDEDGYDEYEEEDDDEEDDDGSLPNGVYIIRKVD